MFMGSENCGYITDTAGLLRLAENAKKISGNRQANLPVLKTIVDPDGFHVLTMQLLHNDCEWRTMWYIKVRNEEEPLELWLDVDLDVLEKELTKHLTGIGGLKIMGGEGVPGWP